MCRSYHPLTVATPNPDGPAFTRRQFLNAGLAMVAAASSVPAFVARAGTRVSAAAGLPGTPDDRVLVVVQLSGGNDGLNTVIPFADRAYRDARPGIAVAEKDVLVADAKSGVGLHPALRDIYDMMGEGLAGVVQGVGYPNPNRSHFASMDIWHSADLEGGRGHGWIGKALDAAPPGDPLTCVSIGAEAPMATQGKRVKPVAFERTELFRWAARDLHPALSEAYDALNAKEPTAASVDDAVSFVHRTALDAQIASDRVRRAVAQQSQTTFPANALARQLEAVAKMIRADLPTRIYYVAMGGFDTHANQANRHQQLLTQFSQSMRAFYNELNATGDGDRVVTLAFSEFGRRVAQNASGGTDHGAAGPSFLFGNAVKPGLLNAHPSLSRLDSGDLMHQVDFRTIYAEILEGWMGLDSRAALGQAFPRARVLKA